jgi:hypothetical protein
VADTDKIRVTEFAPNLFKELRKGIISNKKIIDALSPSANFLAMHNFQIGSGKSPSFFFFSDDRNLMLKTLKSNELDILFEKGFFADYYSYLMEKKK